MGLRVQKNDQDFSLVFSEEFIKTIHIQTWGVLAFPEMPKTCNFNFLRPIDKFNERILFISIVIFYRSIVLSVSFIFGMRFFKSKCSENGRCLNPQNLLLAKPECLRDFRGRLAVLVPWSRTRSDSWLE